MNITYKWKRYWAPLEVPLHQYDFIPNPEGYWADKRLVSFETIQGTPFLVLVGNPGIGKSSTLSDIFDATSQEHKTCIFMDFRDYDSFDELKTDLLALSEFQDWQSGKGSLHLFLDSLDEGRLVMKRLEHKLVRFIRELPYSRLMLRITCREAELPDDFEGLLRALWINEKDKVSVYRLAQLCELDVVRAIEQRNILYENKIDSTQFIEAVKSVDAASFAAYPITLNMLFSIYDDKKHLPDNRREIYSEGCLYRAQENSKSRRDDKFEGEFSSVERVEAAQQIAALRIMCNRPLIYSGPEPIFDQNVLRIQECFDPHNNLSAKSLKLFSETLQSGLFITRREYHDWFHLSCAEYLAAEFIYHVQMPLQQIQSLSINYDEPSQKIAPKLHETMAWLASFRTDVFDWVLGTEPLILLQSNSIKLTNEQIQKVVSHLVQVYIKDEIVEERVRWEDYRKLNIPQLGSYLQSSLIDKNLPQRARNFVMDLVNYCDITSLDNILVELVLDPDEKVAFRLSALSALTRPKRQSEHIEALREVVADPQKYHANEAIIAYSLDILWPDHLSVTELFEHLYLPRLDEDQGHVSFGHLFRDDVALQINVDDLPVALKWIAEQPLRDRTSSVSGDLFIASLMRRAFQYIEYDKILVPFAHAAWALLMAYRPLLTISEDRHRTRFDTLPEEQLAQNSPLRHQLLHVMLSVLTLEAIVNDNVLSQLLPFSAHSFPFVIPQDTYWLIEQTRTDIPLQFRKAYAYLAERLVFLWNLHEDSELISAIYDECNSGQNPILDAQFKPRFSGASSGLEYARKRRDQQLELQRKFQEEPEETFPVEEKIKESLAKCDDDPSHWWIFNHYVLTDQYGRLDERPWDLEEGYGWRYIANDLSAQSQVVNAALRYLQQQNPYILQVDPGEPVHKRRPASSGYRALVLMKKHGLLAQLTEDDWKRWADAIVFTDFEDSKEHIAFNSILLRTTFEYASDQLFERLHVILSGPLDDYHTEMFIRRFFNFGSLPQLESILFEQLQQTDVEDMKYSALLKYLFMMNSQQALVAALDTLRELVKKQELELSKRIISNFAKHCQNGSWWAPVWRIASEDEAFCEMLFNVIIDWHSNLYLQFLSENELETLYLEAVNRFSFADDIEFHGGTVPLRHIRQEWRDSIPKQLAVLGSARSIEVLGSLHKNMPPSAKIDDSLVQARLRFRYEVWNAPKPASVLKLVFNNQLRYIPNADELLNLVIIALKEIEVDIKGDSSKQRSLWDKQADGTFRPVEEEAISDALASWLRERLTHVNVSREVEVRQDTTKPRGQRTDITVETFNDFDDDLMVIIEIKGCWYPDLYTRIRTQLLDEYLANHNRCRHGLFLIAHFNIEKWTWKKDPPSSTCKQSKEDLEAELTTRIAEVDIPQDITIRGVVLHIQ